MQQIIDSYECTISFNIYSLRVRPVALNLITAVILAGTADEITGSSIRALIETV